MKLDSNLFSDRAPCSDSEPSKQYFSSKDLLGQQREVIIIHEGTEYILRLTRQNKLMLVK